MLSLIKKLLVRGKGVIFLSEVISQLTMIPALFNIKNYQKHLMSSPIQPNIGLLLFLFWISWPLRKPETDILRRSFSKAKRESIKGQLYIRLIFSLDHTSVPNKYLSGSEKFSLSIMIIQHWTILMAWCLKFLRQWIHQ